MSYIDLHLPPHEPLLRTVLAVTFGIFFGTLSLGRPRPVAALETPAPSVATTVTKA